MDQKYTYFERDISWLSFNYRVLLEAKELNMPVYERLKFLSIYASNLEEFYKIRVSDHREHIVKQKHANEETAAEELILSKIKEEVTRQQEEFGEIFRTIVQGELRKKGVILYLDEEPLLTYQDFIYNYFYEEVFPFLEPVLLQKEDIRFFLRDNRIYQLVHLKKKETGQIFYATIKIPLSNLPRFIELPKQDHFYHYLFIEDIISYNLPHIFIGYEVLGSYNIKISRDADIYIDEQADKNIVEDVKKKVKKRKIGDLSRFVYDKKMPKECLQYLCEAFNMSVHDLVPDNTYLNLEDLVYLPNPIGKELDEEPIKPISIERLDKSPCLFSTIQEKDIFFNYPYHSFDYFIRFLSEASNNPKVKEIKVTQYRVAENSKVVKTLIDAAQHGKKVTVFVELKARFDEEHNLYTAEIMQQAGINIIYSIPRLKVHAKTAIIIEKADKGEIKKYAYLSTGNFNETTAERYSDMALMTANSKLTDEVDQLFNVLELRNEQIQFNKLLVAQFNMVTVLKKLISREIDQARQGKKAHIILKMNSLQDIDMINELYRASEAGVKIDLIVRGVCCLIPNQAYSQTIRITRIVGKFLEHARVWYFYNDGEENLFLSSADWMTRNLHKRIETAFPILDEKIKELIIQILNIQLKDNVKACFIDEHLNNIFKHNDHSEKVHAQQDIHKLLLG